MPRKDQFNDPLPNPPGLDLSDKKTLTGAKRVATRTNNDFRRMVEKKLPLFADELFADYVPATPESVIERRAILQAGFQEWKREFNQLRLKHQREHRQEVRELVRDDAEFFGIMRQMARVNQNRSRRWELCLYRIKQRLTKSLSETADLVLAWLEVEQKPVTCCEIYRKRGDGLGHQKILVALGELLSLGYVAVIECVAVENCPEKYQTEWTFESVRKVD